MRATQKAAAREAPPLSTSSITLRSGSTTRCCMDARTARRHSVSPRGVRDVHAEDAHRRDDAPRCRWRIGGGDGRWRAHRGGAAGARSRRAHEPCRDQHQVLGGVIHKAEGPRVERTAAARGTARRRAIRRSGRRPCRRLRQAWRSTAVERRPHAQASPRARFPLAARGRREPWGDVPHRAPQPGPRRSAPASTSAATLRRAPAASSIGAAARQKTGGVLGSPWSPPTGCLSDGENGLAGAVASMHDPLERAPGERVCAECRRSKLGRHVG